MAEEEQREEGRVGKGLGDVVCGGEENRREDGDRQW